MPGAPGFATYSRPSTRSIEEQRRPAAERGYERRRPKIRGSPQGGKTAHQRVPSGKLHAASPPHKKPHVGKAKRSEVVPHRKTGGRERPAAAGQRPEKPWGPASEAEPGDADERN